MAEYHFLSTWRIKAPIDRVWDEIVHTERWPSWWKYVVRVDDLEPGDADGVGKRQHLLFRTRLPYSLGFDVHVTRVRAPSSLESDATGELEGTGRWTLTPEDGGTLVRYNWDIRTTKWWMNLLAPVARPAFNWNHDELMREGGESLGRRLGAAVEVEPEGASSRSAGVAWWAVAAATLVALTVAGWRRRSASRDARADMAPPRWIEEPQPDR